MPLKFRFKAREEIPAEHQALYVERDGAWVLDVEGAVEKTRLDSKEVPSPIEENRKRERGRGRLVTLIPAGRKTFHAFNWPCVPAKGGGRIILKGQDL